jgi:F-type H+-transporting ATPase subunit delta
LPQPQSLNQTSAVAAVYAEALLELAAAAKELEAIGDEVRQLAALIESQDTLRLLLGGRLLTAEKRRGVVEQIFQGRVSDLLYRFLQVLARKNRLEQLPDILRLLPHLIQQRQGIQEVQVTTAKALPEMEAAQLTQSLCHILGQKILVKQRVDESLLGGLKLRIGDRLLDGSVAAQLRMLRRKLIDAGREDTRERWAKVTQEGPGPRAPCPESRPASGANR